MGFVSPADEYLEPPLNLGNLLVPNPDSTFFFRMKGLSMASLIMPDSILVVDRSAGVVPGRVVMVGTYHGFLVRRLHRRGGKRFLVPENPEFPDIELQDNMEIFGVCTSIARTL